MVNCDVCEFQAKSANYMGYHVKKHNSKELFGVDRDISISQFIQGRNHLYVISVLIELYWKAT